MFVKAIDGFVNLARMDKIEVRATGPDEWTVCAIQYGAEVVETHPLSIHDSPEAAHEAAFNFALDSLEV